MADQLAANPSSEEDPFPPLEFLVPAVPTLDNTGAEPDAIVTGPDGNLWFTDLAYFVYDGTIAFSQALGVATLPLEVTEQPPVGVDVGQSFSVTVDDLGDPNFDGPITLQMGENPGDGAALGGATTVTAVDGVATFSGLTLNECGIYTLQVPFGSLPLTTTDSMTVSPGAASLSFGNLSFIYDGSPQPVAVTTNPPGLTGVSPVTYTQNGVSSTSPPTAAGKYTVSASLPDNPNYTATPITGTLDIAPATPVITWATPANIVYGTPLGAAQLNATASVQGSFAYFVNGVSAQGLVLHAGNDQVLTSVFTPGDQVDEQSVTTTVMLNVTPAPLIVTAEDQTKVYGAGLTDFDRIVLGLRQ